MAGFDPRLPPDTTMQRILTLAFALAMIAGAADAKQCRDTHGKFIRCPSATGVPICTKGKLCGHTGIAKSATCRVQVNANAPPPGSLRP